MKKQVRHCANDDSYTQAPQLPKWIRELLGFLIATAIVLPIMLLITVDWWRL